MMKHLIPLYQKRWIRLPLKFTVCLLGIKISFDFFLYCIFGFQVDLPRWSHIEIGQNPLNPPVLMPYPFESSTKSLKELEEYNLFTHRVKYWFLEEGYRTNTLYTDLPGNQNPHVIDSFFQYGKVNAYHQELQYKILQKFTEKNQNGERTVQGLNQLLRKLEQYKLDYHKPVVPQL